MSLKLNIAYNKRTKQLIGYSKPNKDGKSILVTAYAVDDLTKKFNKEAEKENTRIAIQKSGRTAAQVYGEMIEEGDRIMLEGMKAAVEKKKKKDLQIKNEFTKDLKKHFKFN